MTNIENHRIFTTLVAIAALASVLVVSASVIRGHIALAQTTNSKVNPIQQVQTNSNTSTGGIH